MKNIEQILPNELSEFEKIYRNLSIQDTLELVSQIKSEYNSLKEQNQNINTMNIIGYLMKSYNKSIIKEVLVEKRDNQYFIDKCTKNSITLFLNLLNKVSAKIGNIIDLSNLTTTSGNDGAVLNGIVIGENGKVNVESILAGGNIQRLHIRTLIKEIK